MFMRKINLLVPNAKIGSINWVTAGAGEIWASLQRDKWLVLSQDLEEKSECAVCWQIDSKEKGESMLAQFLLSNSQVRKSLLLPLGSIKQVDK